MGIKTYYLILTIEGDVVFASLNPLTTYNKWETDYSKRKDSDFYLTATFTPSEFIVEGQKGDGNENFTRRN